MAKGIPVKEKPEQNLKFLFPFPKALKSVIFHSSIMGPGNINIWVKKLKGSGIFFSCSFQLYPTFWFLQIVPWQTRAFPSPFYQAYFWFSGSTSQLLTHLFVCFSICNFCPLQRAGLPREITVTYFISNAFRKAF